ncbi:MAG: MFS transporter [Pseudomonadales bacterium]|nr:MFS transporter [Pseudomonadales bacterium]
MKPLVKDRKTLLFILAGASPIAFATWQTLLNNFSIEVANFSGQEIGYLQSLREIPGFLAFTVIYVLLLIRQQNLAVLSLLILGLGTALTGFFPTIVGLYITTVIMSVGFHYLETMQSSLSLQWLDKSEAPTVMGQLISVRSIATLTCLGGLYLALQFIELNYTYIYSAAGFLTVAVALFCWMAIPHFKDDIVQKNELFLRKRYWLYYLLTFMAGARRQIFTVFAGFLLVEKFGFPLESMVLLVLANAAINIYAAPKIGKLISFIGERRALTLEYCGLIGIFLSYAVVDNIVVAIVLYILDHIFFSMAIAIKTYFQKIADPADISATAGISFTINHIAAVVLPAMLGLVWIVDHSAVFVIGAAIAVGSLILSQLIPNTPTPGNEIRWNDGDNKIEIN